MSSVWEYAFHILTSKDLEEKLIPPPRGLLDSVESCNKFNKLFTNRIPDLPERNDRIKLTNEKSKIPRLEHLNDPRNIALSLHHFANHELMAIELFAWAILSFPDAPVGIRRGFLKSLEEEQNHFRLYTKRMNDLGVEFGDRPLNQLFWKQIPKMRTLEKFSAILSVSLEGANLDFSLIYKQAFKYHGDEISASIMEKVFLDEIKHVKRGLSVLKNTKPKSMDDWNYYTSLLEHPFTPRRAKAYFFIPSTRKKAGFSDLFISKLGEYTDEFSGRVHMSSLEKVGITSADSFFI